MPLCYYIENAKRKRETVHIYRLKSFLFIAPGFCCYRLFAITNGKGEHQKTINA